MISFTGLDGSDTGSLEFGVIFSYLKIHLLILYSAIVVSNPTVSSQLTVNNFQLSTAQ